MNPLALLNRTVRAVIRREYLQRVTNKWFLVTTFGVPLVLFAFSLLPGWLAASGGGGGGPLRIGVVDRTGADMGPAVATELSRRAVQSEDEGIGAPDTARTGDALPASGADSGEEGSFIIAVPAVGLPASLDRKGLSDRLRTSEFDAYLVLGRGILSGGNAELLSTRSIGLGDRPEIQRAVRTAAIAIRLDRAGLPRAQADSLLRLTEIGLSTARVAEGGVQSRAAGQVAGFGMGFILYFMLIIYGQMIVKGVIEEKSSDIVEVLLSSLRPWELMLGKIIGVGAVGLTQVAIWAVVVLLAATWGLAAAAPALADAGVDLGAVLGLPLLEIAGMFLLFFILGYLLYSSLFAGAGAMAGSEQDTQQVVVPITMLIAAGFILLFPMMESPGATWAVVASQIPLFSPVLMPARVAIGAAPAWEVALSTALLTAGVLGAVWLAGRIYRVGILMSGKRPNLPELIRWVRYG